jgi:hypothetical protein
LLEGPAEWRVSDKALRDSISWQQHLGHAVRFLQTQGCLPKAKNVLEGLDGKTHPVGTWLAYQRACARAGRLPDSRRQELDEQLPGWEQAGRIVC